MKSHVYAGDKSITNDPELQPSAELCDLEKQLQDYFNKAQETFKAWLAKKGLPIERSRLTEYATEIGGLDFYYEDCRHFDELDKPRNFVLKMNVGAMGSFDPNDATLRETQYYTTVGRFMMDKGLRDELRSIIESFIGGKKGLEAEYRRLCREHEVKVRAKVDEINRKIDQENFQTQLDILKGRPIDGYTFIIKCESDREPTGFTYRNKPVRIAEKQEYSWNVKSVPTHLVRVVGIG